ncbi:DUF3006 family protein [Caloramator sp. mosi_1]|uniref:DUF3006 family protein n=1 Tax=Caloramator sp. mosi_1 TaxID=3023090 RepID=UPI00236288F8|nr:DUF3006 family protein [Caloramator sp. mosi_1]WDC84949.1 DUF3006 family protein [Caloramator sp. mosi_1]
MKGVVDRVEGNVVVVVLDDGDVIDVNTKEFKAIVKEGDVVYKDCCSWDVDEEETLNRKRSREVS